MAAVVSKGKKLGIKETNTILTEENKIDINMAIKKIASDKLVNKFSIR